MIQSAFRVQRPPEPPEPPELEEKSSKEAKGAREEKRRKNEKGQFVWPKEAVQHCVNKTKVAGKEVFYILVLCDLLERMQGQICVAS